MAKGILNVGGGVVSVDSSGNFTVDTGLIADGASVFNETGVDVDFRVESDDNANMLFVDGGNDRVGIGISTPKTHLTVEGTVTLKEQADAESDTAAYGQIWVNTATPNELYYTTDSGVDIQLTNAKGNNLQDSYGNILGHSTAGDALNTSNGGNVALGCNAAGAQTTGLNNVAIGCHAMAASADDADNNIAIGKLAMGGSDVSGANNIAIGTNAADALLAGACNIAIGENALGASTTGNYNVAIGSGAADSVSTSGSWNIAIGLDAYGTASTGCNNIGIGHTALGGSDTTGYYNIALGVSAMDAMLGGHSNIAMGLHSLGAATVGLRNIAIGDSAMSGVTTGQADNNIAIGQSALAGVAGTTGDSNIAIGTTALDALESGGNNVAIGKNSMGAVTTGGTNTAVGICSMGAGVTTGADNVAIGNKALCLVAAGAANVALGLSAADALTTGACNIAIGTNALGAATTGCLNIAIGDMALSAAVACGGANQAEHNIGIGSCAGCSTSTGSCATAIGFKAGRDVTSQAGVTNLGFMANSTTADTTCIAGGCVMGAVFTATSDCRSKKEIKDLPYGLDFINLLRPVSYKWKPQSDKLDKEGNLIEEGERFHTHQRTNFGLLGQQVKETLTKLGLNYNDFSGYQDKEEEHGPSGWKPSYNEENKTVSLAYDDFIAPLIKSVQELSAEVTELKAKLKTI